MPDPGVAAIGETTAVTDRPRPQPAPPPPPQLTPEQKLRIELFGELMKRANLRGIRVDVVTGDPRWSGMDGKVRELMDRYVTAAAADRPDILFQIEKAQIAREFAMIEAARPQMVSAESVENDPLVRAQRAAAEAERRWAAYGEAWEAFIALLGAASAPGALSEPITEAKESELAERAAREALERNPEPGPDGPRISAGARVLEPWNGDPQTLAKAMIAARRRVPAKDAAEVSRLYAQSTRAALGEEAAWKAAIHDHREIGLQAPGHANARGVDFITAVQKNGQWEIIITDVKTTTTGVQQDVRAEVPDSWSAEVAAAVSPATLRLGDGATEAAIRDAYQQGRVSIRRIVVDYSPAGQGAISGF